jgi:hypothetical protein
MFGLPGLTSMVRVLADRECAGETNAILGPDLDRSSPIVSFPDHAQYIPYRKQEPLPRAAEQGPSFIPEGSYLARAKYDLDPI